MLTVLRARIRAARDHPLLRPLIGCLDRLWWARVIRRADVVDLEYVRAQTGRRLSETAAIRRYVRGGYRAGLRLSPLFVDTAVGDHLPEAWRVPALYAYLVADPRGLQVSPLWNAVAYGEAHPEAWEMPGGPLAHAWRNRWTHSLPSGPSAEPARRDWRELSAVVVAATDGARQGVEVAAPEASMDLDREFLIALGPDEWDFDESLAEAVLFAAEPHHGVAIAVLDDRAEDWMLASLLSAVCPRVRVSRRRHGDASAALSELLATSRAEVVVFRGPNETLLASDAARLAERVEKSPERTAFAPVWRDADGTIAAVGATSEGRFLAGHPVEDLGAFSVSIDLEVPALAGSTFAARRSEVDVPLRGTDPASALSGRSMVALDLETRRRSAVPRADLHPIAADATDLLRAAGWERAVGGLQPRVRRPRRAVVVADNSTVPVLRWALRTAAPVGPRAEGWGDTHFARALAAALRRLGQEVVVDSFAARNRPTVHLDDVTVVLRGPEPISPSAHGVSLLWIISHPDEVSATEMAGFDRVFAASEPWSDTATRELGVPVTPLLQCTDVTRFHPTGRSRGNDIVFVGTARGIHRPSIVEPIRAGIPVTVIGPDWRGWIPAERIAATGIDNDALPGLYESAGVVLNDHWPAMQEKGFIGNRLFDVIAAGGRAVSDRVDGIDHLFAGAVRMWDTVPELIDVLSGDLDAVFPGDPEREAVSARVRAEHSFDARARTLLEAALHARGDDSQTRSAHVSDEAAGLAE